MGSGEVMAFNHGDPADVPVVHADGMDRLIDAILNAITFSHVVAMFSAIGVMATMFVGYVLIAYAWESLRDNRRRDRLALNLAWRAWSELSPAELLEAEQRWPAQFALARFLNDRARDHWRDHARAQLDDWFEAQREEARER